MRPKRFLSLPVLAVLLLMMFVYYTTIFVFIDGSFDLQSSNGTFNAAIFTILASFSIFSFFVCVLSDPGHIPSSYVPDVEGQGSAKDNAERKKCDKCYGYKPPRTHHCRVCKKCVLKMDHHCLWINNCVGYWNYKAFFVFTSYATLASIHSMILFICSVFLMDKGSSSKMFYVMYGTMAIGLTTTLLTLFGWHVYLILHNMTTIEYYEGKRAKWLAMKSGQSYRHPFNISPYKNITSVLGPNILKWLCPTAVSHLKEGVSFPTLRDSS
ncbi:probable protein S-acyltransferase 15 [Arachis stenosperma]|uniref:probable protein S-acyltransferase 15 n=1 Tax=Arachis stenosperma TaxID=217475 RepID=UPI0025ACA188|nr:probable protein S-acyltransferase 15 [Arachis stenosperma]